MVVFLGRRIMRMARGATLIEMMIVLVILGILSSTAMPMYADYASRSRTSEVPLSLKKIIEAQITFKETNETATFASSIASLGWSTSGDDPATPDLAEGSFYIFFADAMETCNMGAMPLEGLALAVVRAGVSVPSAWEGVCMDEKMSIYLLP